MKPARAVTAFVLSAAGMIWGDQPARAWSEHALLTRPAFEGVSGVANAEQVRVEPLESFLCSEAGKLEKLLDAEEAWARKNLRWYRPRPDALAFKAGEDKPNLRERFCRAIRINPACALATYLQLLPNENVGHRSAVSIDRLTFLRDKSTWKGVAMVQLTAGELVSPLAVLATASDEPDLGLDVGLFSDNGTSCGAVYGFGRQPFGNPNLDYGSQAPFHMGFYHESTIAYILAGFLKETYPEYRIHLYKSLSEFAFRTGHPYWGWRFAGWGLHYIADLCQPYHSTALPRVSTARAIWINTLASIGIGRPKTKAVQLVSNRHLAFERFLQLELRKAYRSGQTNSFLLQVLRTGGPPPQYDDETPRRRIAKFSHDMAATADRTIAECMPAKYVCDPSFEFGTSTEQDRLLDEISAENGEAAISRLGSVCKDLLAIYGSYARGYIGVILNNRSSRK
ncbi:MAG: hypothetical protein N3G20_07955 [Verrucomicrobiae bacterium]|nr:hypothetical protein [Verrucomicrobiae bacterium]